MQKVSTLVLDVFDDEGALLKETFGYDELPTQMKTANLNTEHDDWALVLEVEGTEFKKFACNDAGNTAVSLLYFLNNYEKLPDEAVKIAAVNLLDSAGRFKLYVPPELREIADRLRGKGDTYTRRKWEERDNLINMDKLEIGYKLATQYKDATYKLLGKYPIDTFGQVKQAMEYFKEYWSDFTPAERREYCVGLEKRANDLMMDIDPRVAAWAGKDYGDRYQGFIDRRRGLVPETEAETLDMLVEKRAHVSPAAFASALEEFDRINGLDSKWNEIGDPYYVTYSKTAKEYWYYHDEEGRIYEKDLHDLAARTDLLKQQFSKEFMEKFVSNPKGTFESAAEPIKKLLLRLCRHKWTRF